MLELGIFIGTIIFLLVFCLLDPFGKDWEDPKNQPSSRSPNVCVLCGKPAAFLCRRCEWVQEGKDNGR